MIIELSQEDLDFRPTSYFWPLTYETHVVNTIKGERRRELARNSLDFGLTPLEGRFAAPGLDDEDRAALEQLHPSFMGGEYLPDRHETEVEIARICVQSAKSEVVCVYVRPVGKRLHYRVVDEHGGATLQGKTTRTSVRPLKLREVVRLIIDTWNVFAVLEQHGIERSRAHMFVHPTSEFYRDFSLATRVVIDAWFSLSESKTTL